MVSRMTRVRGQRTLISTENLEGVGNTHLEERKDIAIRRYTITDPLYRKTAFTVQSLLGATVYLRGIE
jgi:hypothetical protein